MCTPDNYNETKAFYRDLGFECTFDNERDACGFNPGLTDTELLVTLHFGIEAPKNAMIQFRVDDAQAWYDYMMELELDQRHPSVTITPPVLTDWGWYITYVADPAGVKLHFGQYPPPQIK
jgi:catechol 2,3-dioxygenase-like lactoylglutathione lyase family enzyme